MTVRLVLFVPCASFKQHRHMIAEFMKSWHIRRVDMADDDDVHREIWLTRLVVENSDAVVLRAIRDIAFLERAMPFACLGRLPREAAVELASMLADELHFERQARFDLAGEWRVLPCTAKHHIRAFYAERKGCLCRRCRPHIRNGEILETMRFHTSLHRRLRANVFRQFITRPSHHSEQRDKKDKIFLHASRLFTQNVRLISNTDDRTLRACR